MALNWDFKRDFCGTLVIEQIHDGEPKQWTMRCYTGNAMLIMLDEWDETDDNGKTSHWYRLYNFISDVDHLKNLKKNCPEIFEDWKELTIIRENYGVNSYWKKNLKQLISVVSECNPKCKIVLE